MYIFAECPCPHTLLTEAQLFLLSKNSSPKRENIFSPVSLFQLSAYRATQVTRATILYSVTTELGSCFSNIQCWFLENQFENKFQYRCTSSGHRLIQSFRALPLTSDCQALLVSHCLPDVSIKVYSFCGIYEELRSSVSRITDFFFSNDIAIIFLY